MNHRCRLLDWDSEFFGCRIATLGGNRLAPQEVDEIMRWCADGKIDCLYFLADSRCADTATTAETNGFAFKDLRMTFEWKRSLGATGLRPQIGPQVKVRTHREPDLAAVVLIARSAHTDTRFFFDRRFDRDAAALLYETWIRKACAAPDARVFVGETMGELAGYLSCHRSGPQAGHIGLAAVDPRFHGQGIGRAMIEAALRWFADQEITDISVVTQGRNVAAQRFYQSAGFLTRSIECWYHKWFS
jgi:dTDP-4-amino-4,6-dideoxy-D-galactose acyltransferase